MRHTKREPQQRQITFMTEKMLIVGGCSNSDQGHRSYVEEGVFVWPQIVADELGMKLFNVAKTGMSNDFIENTVFDAVMHHHDIFDCTVMIFWTDANRVNVHDRRTFWRYNTNITDGNPGKKEIDPITQHADMFQYDEIYPSRAIDKSFRNMRRMKFVCDTLNVPICQRLGLGFVKQQMNASERANGGSGYHDEGVWTGIAEWLRAHSALKEFDLSFFEAMAGRWSTESEASTPDMRLKCDHPNQKGHDSIAQMFIDTLNGVPMKSADYDLTGEKVPVNTLDFVYD